MLRIVKFLFILIVIIAGMAIHLRNDQLVSFDYYLGSIELPFSLFLVIAVCIGAVAGLVATVPTIIRLGRERARLASKARLNEKELETLRVIPLKE